jgi:hypothetical protein
MSSCAGRERAIRRRMKNSKQGDVRGVIDGSFPDTPRRRRKVIADVDLTQVWLARLVAVSVFVRLINTATHGRAVSYCLVSEIPSMIPRKESRHKPRPWPPMSSTTEEPAKWRREKEDRKRPKETEGENERTLEKRGGRHKERGGDRTAVYTLTFDLCITRVTD